MSLADIFSELQTSPVPDELELEAEKVADLFDELEGRRLELSVAQKKLQDEIRVKLLGLVEACEVAEKNYAEHCAKMMETMKTKGVDEIPLKDRPPIYIKVVKGSKKSITKKWLCSSDGLGSQAGEALWIKVPPRRYYQTRG